MNARFDLRKHSTQLTRQRKQRSIDSILDEIGALLFLELALLDKVAQHAQVVQIGTKLLHEL